MVVNAMWRLVLVVMLAVAPAVVHAEPAETVVTVTGKVAKPNRPAFDAFRDRFFAFHNLTFEHAHAFSRPELEALGMQELTVRYPGWPAPVHFRGPRLRDVLAAAGATGATVFTQALDGYAVSLPAAAAGNAAVLLAIEADGQPLPIGGRGPAWVVFPPGAVPGLAADSDADMAWAVFHIKVE